MAWLVWHASSINLCVNLVKVGKNLVRLLLQEVATSNGVYLAQEVLNNLQVLMDENKELPPSSFLSASVWLPASPSFLLLVRFFYWPACFFLYGRLFHWTDFYRPSHLINRIDVCQKYSWGFYLASDIFDGVSSSLTSCVLKKVFLHWISKKETKWKERAPSQNLAHTPFTLVKKKQSTKQTNKKRPNIRSQRHLERYSSRPKVHAGPFFPFGWVQPPSDGPRSKLLLLSRASWCFFTFLGRGMLQNATVNIHRRSFGHNVWPSQLALTFFVCFYYFDFFGSLWEIRGLWPCLP